MKLLTAFSIFVTASRAAVGRDLVQKPWDCNKIWRFCSPCKDDELHKCVGTKYIPPVTSDARTLAHLYRYEEEWTTRGSQEQLDLVITTTKEALKIFNAFDTYNLLDVYIFLIHDQPPPTPGFGGLYANTDTATYFGRDSWAFHPDCRVKIYPLMWNSGTTEERVKQLIAHELYHCVQLTNHWETNEAAISTDKNPTPADWWYEGAAVYMSNQVYKTADQENEYLVYNPEDPIYHQTRGGGYGPFLFFHAMEEGGLSANNINEWIVKQNSMSTYAAERHRLSSLVPKFDDDFELFAKLYSLDGIHDNKGGRVFQTKDRIKPVPLDVPYVEKGDSVSVPVNTIPFTIPLYKLQLPAGNTFTASFTSKAKQLRISYHYDGETKWNSLRKDETLKIDCSADQTFFFLVTSTDNVDRAEAQLKFTKTEVKDCKCKEVKRQEDGGEECPEGSDTCLIGKWNIDKEVLKGILKKAIEQQTPEDVVIKVNSIDITGTGALVISEDNSANFTYGNFRINTVAESLGIPVRTSVWLNGEMWTTMTKIGKGNLKFAVIGGKGESGFSAPIIGDVTTPIGGPESLPKGMVVKYGCGGNRFEMIGYYNDVVYQGFSFGFVRAT